MSTVTLISGVQLCVPSSSNSSSRINLFSSPSVNFSGKSRVPKQFNSLKLKRKDEFFTRKTEKLSKSSWFTVRCDASSGKITQQEFTEMAWQANVSSPEIAKENKHQIVETGT